MTFQFCLYSVLLFRSSNAKGHFNCSNHFINNIAKIYSETQLKDTKTFVTFLQLRKYFQNKAFLFFIERPICNSAKCKLKFMGQWLRYNTMPNVTTLFNKNSQAISLLSYFVLQTWPGLSLFSNFDHRKVFTPIYESLHRITCGNFFSKNG